MKDAEELDRLVRRDVELGRKIAPHEKVRDACLQACTHRGREAEATFERDAGDALREREAVRGRILAIWKAGHDAETTLALPAAKVSRRNYTEIKIRDRNALYDALDRAGRLDLVGYAFDEKEILELLRKGGLKGLPAGAVQTVDRFNLQVMPRKGDADAEAPG